SDLLEPGGDSADDADDHDGDDDRDGDDNDDDDDAAPGAVVVVDGESRLILDPDIQARAGVVVAPVRAIRFDSAVRGLASVVEIGPLVALRDRYLAEVYEAEIIDTRLKFEIREYERLQALFEDNANIAKKTVQHAEAAWRIEEARRTKAWAALNTLRDQADREWGPVLAGWAFADKHPTFARLAARQEALLLVSLPIGEALPAETGRIRVARVGDAGAPREAEYVSPATAVAPARHGETHYFRTDGSGLRAGMRLDAWIDRAAIADQGAFVPASAVIWSLGRAWVYVRIAEDQFVRRGIPTDAETEGGWFVADGLRPGETLVVAGAQMLFAEEFRWQIRDEDDD
ncbi:MAG: hypothetical protein QF926_11390, partial [Alphaproteobacteria bacterium]|nr:hypothetical protein [Alphaproteobacteria bacterium]